MKYIWLALILLVSCKTTDKLADDQLYEHITDRKARAIIKESITFYGGLEKWKSISQLSYTKDFDLLLEDGSIEKSYEQQHHYSYQPLDIRVESLENGQMVISHYDGTSYTRSIDGKRVELAPDKIAKGLNSSLYVIGIPYKLLDEGVALSYAGKRTMEDGRVVDVVRASYDAVAHENHSSTDIWEYYFDEERKIVANWVQTDDHANLVENLSFERVGGLLMNKDRKSYRLDENNNKTYLRASYSYGEYQLRF